jgi:hypothetical protein
MSGRQRSGNRRGDANDPGTCGFAYERPVNRDQNYPTRSSYDVVADQHRNDETTRRLLCGHCVAGEHEGSQREADSRRPGMQGTPCDSHGHLRARGMGAPSRRTRNIGRRDAARRLERGCMLRTRGRFHPIAARRGGGHNGVR